MNAARFFMMLTFTLLTPLQGDVFAEEKPTEEVQRLILKLEQELKDKGKGPKPLMPGWQVADELGKLGPEAAPAIPVLIKALQDDKFVVRSSAALALGQIGEKAVPALIEALSHKDPWACYYAVVALGNVGSPARPAVPQLLALLDSPNAKLRGIAAETLGEIGRSHADEVVPALAKRLTDSDSSVRAKAAEGLSGFGSRAKPALPTLLKLLQDQKQSTWVRSHSLAVLGAIGSADKDVLSTLTKALEDDNAKLRLAAAQAIFAIGPAAQATIPALIKVLDQPLPVPKDLKGDSAYEWDVVNGMTSYQAIMALSRMGKDAEPALPTLEKLANSKPNPEARKFSPEIMPLDLQLEARNRALAGTTLERLRKASKR